MAIVYAALSLGVLGLIFGVLLGFASKKFEVKVDERVPKLRECLPGANCGGCGYAGCDAYAEAVVTEGAKGTLCSVGGADVAEKIGSLSYSRPIVCSVLQPCLNNFKISMEFSDSPVVRTLHFHCRGQGFDPWSGN